MNISRQILSEHLISGALETGTEIAVRIDQTLTQDATGTMAYLQFEAMGVDRVKTRRSVSYVDHNTLQSGFENADDHAFLESMAAKYGIVFSGAGNGICHQVHLERFGVPGQTLIGSDSHTPTAGGLGMLAFGAGGLDVACAMAGEPFYLTMPSIVRVTLTGALKPWVSAKDIALEMLRRLSVKGGRGKIFEYAGPGLRGLSVPERSTITNMGTELGATTSIFPSDAVTRSFLRSQGRLAHYRPLMPAKDAPCDGEIVIELNTLEPLIALPHSPDKVQTVRSVAGTRVDQVAIGSCTNASLRDLMLVARLLKGRKIPAGMSLVVSPGSRQVLTMLARSGALADIAASGARVIESACGPCIGMGQAPRSGAVSLRTFNRNFEGRSGTKDAQVYLCSPEVAVAAALAGEIAEPSRFFGPRRPAIPVPGRFLVDDGCFRMPQARPRRARIVRGPNIKPLPVFEALPDHMSPVVAIRLGDNISTDHILPAGAKILPLRSNLPAISEFTFAAVDPGFAARSRAAGASVIVAGENYGQGSSREHAALAPRYLGVRAVIAKSFARIHLANLINFGILPLVFVNPSDHELFTQGLPIAFAGITETLGTDPALSVRVNGKTVSLSCALSTRQADIIRAGGLLNWIRARGAQRGSR